MWPNSLRLALTEHVEKGRQGDQAAPPDATSSSEHKNSAPMVAEETLETPTPKQQTMEVFENTPAAGE